MSPTATGGATGAHDDTLEERLRRAFRAAGDQLAPESLAAATPGGSLVPGIAGPRRRVALRAAVTVAVVAAVGIPTAVALTGRSAPARPPSQAGAGVAAPHTTTSGASAPGFSGASSAQAPQYAGAQAMLRYGYGILRNDPCTLTARGTLSCPGALTVPGVSVSIQVDASRVVAGSPIRADVSVTNDTGHDVSLPAGTCPDSFALALTNASYTPAVSFTTPACSPPARLRAGWTVIRTTVLTTYEACIQPGSGTVAPRRPLRPGSTTSTVVPMCSGTGRTPPPLPAGRYAVVLVPDTFPLPPAQGTPFVTLVAPRSASTGTSGR